MKGIPKDKPRVKKTEGMLSLKASQWYHFSKGATSGEGDGPDEEGHG